ncbi:site-specific integrase [Pontibacter cellulosilyticus]|uniref:Site-specific integrase n=1 Tax=Pontibacter cellulosilyticus TaxID=1720253 RepID=A0A923SI41_9BACT|nr:site-specific integrase [Pontibacter cellulosilyticus]MBC5992409.1 site-specific integrase [Pontibacter cellulosilyticus]
MKKAITSIILDKRRPLKDGTYPVKLRVTYQRQQKYYPVPCSITEEYSLPANYSFTEEEFQKAQMLKPRGMYKDIQTDLQAFEGLAADIVKTLQHFSFEAFEKQLYNTSAGEDVFAAFDRMVGQLEMESRLGTADSYRCAANSIRAFAGKKALPFSAVTPDFLKGYEAWMLANGKSLTTVGIYLRPLRAVFNEAIATGDLKQELYPFGKRKYVIPAGQNVKKALSLDDIEKIYNYKPTTDSESKFKELWMFTYLCNGINVKDIAHLRYSNIDVDKIVFIRAKTQRTSRQNLKPVVAMLTPELEEIIDRWGNKPKTQASYVFPLLSEGLTPEQERQKIKQATKNINKYIDRIAKAVGIEKDVTTYTARHSFSTVLKRAGVSMAEISEALGHKDLKTTESYLDSFEDDVKRRHSGMLTAFKKKKLNE